MTPTPPNIQVQLAYSIPSIYSNLVSFTYINGLFRVTFFEQHLNKNEGTPELDQILSPRVSVTLTPATFAELLKIGGGLYNKIAAAAQGADAWGGGSYTERSGGTIQ